MSIFSKVVPFSIFCRNMDKILEELEMTRQAMVVTLHGRGKFMLQSLERYQEIEELAQYARECAAVNNAMSKGSNVE